MTIIEQRKDKRFPLARQPPGTFRLMIAEATYSIQVIRDISSSGIRVYLPVALAEHLQVIVEYTEPSFKLEVNGMVVWCTAHPQAAGAAESTHRFIVGIQLLSPFLLMAMSGTY